MTIYCVIQTSMQYPVVAVFDSSTEAYDFIDKYKKKHGGYYWVIQKTLNKYVK